MTRSQALLMGLIVSETKIIDVEYRTRRLHVSMLSAGLGGYISWCVWMFRMMCLLPALIISSLNVSMYCGDVGGEMSHCCVCFEAFSTR